MNKKGMISVGVILVIIIIGFVILSGAGAVKIIRTMSDSPILWIFLGIGLIMLLKLLKGGK